MIVPIPEEFTWIDIAKINQCKIYQRTPKHKWERHDYFLQLNYINVCLLNHPYPVEM